jgi:hypothetical protein
MPLRVDLPPYVIITFVALAGRQASVRLSASAGKRPPEDPNILIISVV